MAVEDDRRPGLAAAEPADHDRRRRERLVEHLDLQPDLARHARVAVARLGGVAGRALDLDELEGQVAEPVGVDGSIIGCLSRQRAVTRNPMWALRRPGPARSSAAQRRWPMRARARVRAAAEHARSPSSGPRGRRPRRTGRADTRSRPTPRRSRPCRGDRTGSRPPVRRRPATSSRASGPRRRAPGARPARRRPTETGGRRRRAPPSPTPPRSAGARRPRCRRRRRRASRRGHRMSLELPRDGAVGPVDRRCASGRGDERRVLLVRHRRRRELDGLDLARVPRRLVGGRRAVRRTNVVPEPGDPRRDVEQSNPSDGDPGRRGEAKADVVVDRSGQHPVPVRAAQPRPGRGCTPRRARPAGPGRPPRDRRRGRRGTRGGGSTSTPRRSPRGRDAPNGAAPRRPARPPGACR